MVPKGVKASAAVNAAALWCEDALAGYEACALPGVVWDAFAGAWCEVMGSGGICGGNFRRGRSADAWAGSCWNSGESAPSGRVFLLK